MDGIRYPSDGIVTVERSFEWSRLENEVMSLAYEYLLPGVRSASASALRADHEAGCNEFGRSGCGRQRYATGA